MTYDGVLSFLREFVDPDLSTNGTWGQSHAEVIEGLYSVGKWPFRAARELGGVAGWTYLNESGRRLIMAKKRKLDDTRKKGMTSNTSTTSTTSTTSGNSNGGSDVDAAMKAKALAMTKGTDSGSAASSGK